MRGSAVLTTLIAVAGLLGCNSEPAGPRVRVVLSTDSLDVNTGDSVRLTAQVSGATPAPALTWRSLDSMVAAVSASGTVHGVRPGFTRIVASVSGAADTARVRVIAHITASTVTPHLDTLTFFFDGVRLAARSAAGAATVTGDYIWIVEDTSVVRAGLVSPDTLVATAVRNGVTWVRLVERGGTHDSAQIVVRQVIARIEVAPLLGYRSCPVRLVAIPLDSGGAALARPVAVTLRSADTTIATLDSTTRWLSPRLVGQTSITASAEGTTSTALFSVRAAPSVGFGAPAPVWTVGAGQFLTASLGWESPTPAAFRLRITTTDTAVARAIPADTTIPPGYSSVGGIELRSASPGTATVRPVACDVPGDSATVIATAPRLVLVAPLPGAARTDDRPWSGEVHTADSRGIAHPVVEPVTVRVLATDSTVVRPDSAGYHVSPGRSDARFTLTWSAHGDARVLFVDSTGRYLADTSGTIVVRYPPLFMRLLDSLTIGMRQEEYLDVGTDRPVPDPAGVTVRLATSDTTLVRMVPDSLTIPQGAYGAAYTAVTRDTTGVATLTATADRYEPTALTVTVDRPRFILYVASTGLPHYPGDPPADVILNATDSLSPTTVGSRGVTENVIGEIASSDPTVASVDSASLTIRAGEIASGVAHLSFGAPGEAVLTATDARSAFYHYAPGTSQTIRIVPKRLVFADSLLTMGVGQSWSDAVCIEGRIPQELVVALSHSTPAVASLSGDATTVFSSSGCGGVGVAARAAGRDSVIAAASGWISDTAVVDVGTGTVSLQGWPTTIAAGDSVPIYLQIRDQVGNVRAVSAATTFTLTPNAALAFSAGGAPITAVTVPAFGQTSGYFYVKGVAAGTGTVAVANQAYQAYSNSVLVTGP